MFKRSQLIAAVGTAAILGASQASAALVHEYNFDDLTDSVGTADLTLNGAASLAGGNLVLPGGAARTNMASATGASLAELAGTINGTNELTVVVRYNTSVQQTWSKLFMTGTPGDQNLRSYIDLTPARGNGQGAGITLDTTNTGGDFGPNSLPVIAAGTDAIHIGIWDETTDTMTVYNAIDGDSGSLSTASLSMAGEDLANMAVSEFYVGAAVNWPDPDFNGTVDQVQIYNHALSLSEVQALVPEPTSLALLGLGGLLAARRRR